MSGDVTINDDLSWHSSSRTFLDIVERVRMLLPTNQGRLAETLNQALDSRSLRLDHLSTDDVSQVFEALKQVYAADVREGERRFPTSEYYVEFLEAFRALIGLVGEDPRIGVVIFREDTQKLRAGVRRRAWMEPGRLPEDPEFRG
ncbi:MAG: hypothetical protein HY717_04390 [Planctomycetes bacterium]|nr:hypothetical protein [Planctomycetota bacterium]